MSRRKFRELSAVLQHCYLKPIITWQLPPSPRDVPGGGYAARVPVFTVGDHELDDGPTNTSAVGLRLVTFSLLH